MHSLRVVVICVQALGDLAFRPSFLFPSLLECEFHLQGLSDGLGYLILNFEHAAELTVERIRPEVGIIGHSNELGVHPDHVVFPLNAPLEYSLNIEFLANLFEVPFSALVVHHRSQGNHF